MKSEPTEMKSEKVWFVEEKRKDIYSDHHLEEKTNGVGIIRSTKTLQNKLKIYNTNKRRFLSQAFIFYRKRKKSGFEEF